MHWFYAPSFLPHSSQIHWATGRDEETPADFGNPDEELHTLMEQAAWVDFSHMGMVQVAGPQRIDYFGGLTTQQVRQLAADRTLYGALLTPQGRYLWDFTLVEYPTPEQLLLLTEPDRVPELLQQLKLYILRAKVQVADARKTYGLMGIIGPQAEQAVGRLFPDLALAECPLGGSFTPRPGLRLWRDPRHEKFGWRLLLPAEQWITMGERFAAVLPMAGCSAWEGYRIHHGLPRGGNEWIAHETLPLEAGLQEMNGVDFNKGCYVGQETTARTHYRATLKKRLFQVSGPAGFSCPSGTPVQRDDGKEAGLITSHHAPTGAGMALLRLTDVENIPQHPLFAQGQPLTVHKPSWARWNEVPGDSPLKG
ncbi:MAG: hypothetical protein H7837_11575 [Magnetococcus sp. MYC-9]